MYSTEVLYCGKLLLNVPYTDSVHRSQCQCVCPLPQDPEPHDLMTWTLLVEERMASWHTLHSGGFSMGSFCCHGYWRFDFMLLVLLSAYVCICVQ